MLFCLIIKKHVHTAEKPEIVNENKKFASYTANIKSVSYSRYDDYLLAFLEHIGDLKQLPGSSTGRYMGFANKQEATYKILS